MKKTIIKFGDTEIKKQKFHQYKSPQQFSQTREMIELCCEYFFFFFFFQIGIHSMQG